MNRQTTTTLWCLAVLTGVLNYYGLSLFVPPDAWFQLALCAMTGIGVTLTISTFWNYAFSIIPELRTSGKRPRGWITIVLGVFLILMVSSYWNLIAIAGDEITRLSAGDVVLRAELALAQAIDASGLYRSFISDIAAFNSDVAAIIASEINSGGTSGDPTPGPISNTMTQVGGKLNNLALALSHGGETLASLRANGDQCLAGLHSASASGDAAGVASKVACINGVIGDLAGQDQLAALERGLRTLTDGVVLPATVKTEAQRAIITGFMADQQTRADSITALITAVDVPLIEPISADMPNRMAGVLQHWQSLVPAIATAVAIDLLPLVLLILKTLFFDDRRELGVPQGQWSAAELLDAMRQMDQLRAPQTITPQTALDLPEPFVDLLDDDWSQVETASIDPSDGQAPPDDGAGA